ncbi:MAG: hypothetical protein ACRD6R_04060 [Candidatus Polarisedimenticolia bacterium]
MFLFRLGGTVIKSALAALALAGAVTPFYFYAAWHEMEPPGLAGSFVRPVLGPGMVIRDLLVGGGGESTFRDRLLGHAIVIVGSVAFWLVLLAGLRAMWRWAIGDRSRRSVGAAVALLSLAVMAAVYGLVMTGDALGAGLPRTAFRFLFWPGHLLSVLLGGDIRGHAGGLAGHLLVVGGSWGAWTFVVLLARRIARGKSSRAAAGRGSS